MKNIIIGIASLVLLILITLINAETYGRSARETELENALNASIEYAVQELRNSRKITPTSNEEFISFFMENMTKMLNSRSNVEIEVIDVDYKKGYLTIRATEQYNHLNGNEGKVTVTKTALIDEYKTVENGQIIKRLSQITVYWLIRDNHEDEIEMKKTYEVKDNETIKIKEVTSEGTWELISIEGKNETDLLNEVEIGVSGGEPRRIKVGDTFGKSDLESFYIIDTELINNLVFKKDYLPELEEENDDEDELKEDERLGIRKHGIVDEDGDDAEDENIEEEQIEEENPDAENEDVEKSSDEKDEESDTENTKEVLK